MRTPEDQHSIKFHEEVYKTFEVNWEKLYGGRATLFADILVNVRLLSNNLFSWHDMSAFFMKNKSLNSMTTMVLYQWYQIFNNLCFMVVECYFEWQTIQSGRLNLISGWIHGTKGVLVGSFEWIPWTQWYYISDNRFAVIFGSC